MLSSFNSTYTNFALDRTQLAVCEDCCRQAEQRQRCAEVDQHLEAVETVLQPFKNAIEIELFPGGSTSCQQFPCHSCNFPKLFLRNERRATNNGAVVRGDPRSETLKLT